MVVIHLNNFLVRRLLLIIPIFLGVSIIIFLMMRMIPGDPARILAGENATAQDIQNITDRFGLDQPLVVQYLKFMSGIVTNSVRSLRSELPVFEEVMPRYMKTVQLSSL